MAAIGTMTSLQSRSRAISTAGTRGARPALRPAPVRRTVAAPLRASAPANPASKPPGSGQMLVYVPPHPLVKHWLAVCRNAATPPPMFKSACVELSRILMYEAVKDLLPTIEGQVQTPTEAVADVEFVDPTKPIKAVPILRAGLVMLEDVATILPNMQTFHVGYVRDEDTLEASCYLNKLPEKFDADDRIVVTDPMMATGGSMEQCLDDIMARGGKPQNIRVISILAAPPALTKLSEKFPGLKVYCACIDAELNEKGYIIPGLGDAGDRAYGTE